MVPVTVLKTEGARDSMEFDSASLPPYKGVDMTVKEFYIWLDGYVAGGGNDPEEVKKKVQELSVVYKVVFYDNQPVKEYYGL